MNTKKFTVAFGLLTIPLLFSFYNRQNKDFDKENNNDFI